MKVVEETFRQLLQKVLFLWHKLIFVYIDEFIVLMKNQLQTGPFVGTKAGL